MCIPPPTKIGRAPRNKARPRRAMPKTWPPSGEGTRERPALGGGHSRAQRDRESILPFALRWARAGVALCLCLCTCRTGLRASASGLHLRPARSNAAFFGRSVADYLGHTPIAYCLAERCQSVRAAWTRRNGTEFDGGGLWSELGYAREATLCPLPAGIYQATAASLSRILMALCRCVGSQLAVAAGAATNTA